MGFFEAGELRDSALAGNHLKAFKTHGIIGAVVIAAARKSRLKHVAHGVSVVRESGMNSAAAISCHFQSDVSMVSSADRNVSKKGQGTRKITFFQRNELPRSAICEQLGSMRHVC